MALWSALALAHDGGVRVARYPAVCADQRKGEGQWRLAVLDLSTAIGYSAGRVC